MSSKPRFSIVAPVYNTSAFLSECLDSVEQQTYRNFELVLVDDGSTDNSGKMCDEFAAQHAYARVIHQENQGLLLARRVGLQAARGEYIVTLDSDDMLRTDALELLSAEIDANHPDILTFTFSRATSFALFNPSRLSMPAGYYAADQYGLLKMQICKGRHNNLWSKCYRRAIADVKADYTPFRGLTHAEDLLQVLPIIDGGKTFSYVDEPLYYYRPNPGSATGSYKPRQLKDLSVALDALIRYASSWGYSYLQEARKSALLQLSYLLHMLVNSRLENAMQVEQLERMQTYAKKAGLFGSWEHDLRLDKRLEIEALEKGQWGRVVRRVRVFELLKRVRDMRSK